MTRSNTLWFRRSRAGIGIWLLVAAVSVALGCVSRGSFKAVSDENSSLTAAQDRLEEELERLRSSNESLESERLRLLDTLEETSEQATDLGDRVEVQTRELTTLRSDVTSQVELIDLQKSELDARREEVERLRGTYENLVEDLESEVATGRIEIEQLREGIRLNVSDELLFASGAATLNREGTEVLNRVAGQLAKNQYLIEVQGHTDDRRIRGVLAERFPSNWELAGARAASVSRLLVEQGIDGRRVASVSRAEFYPVADNSTAAGRSLNRRIEIRLLPNTEERAVAETPAEP